MQNLEDAFELKERPEEIGEKVWKKINRTACRVIRLCLSQNVKYDMMNETSVRNI